VHLDSTSFHVDGRYNRKEEPEAEVMHSTRGYSRDHRPDLNQVMLELMVEPQAGIPVRMPPLSGHSSEVKECGHVIKEYMAQLHTTYGSTYLVADSALSSEDHLQKLAETKVKWMTRVPATLSDAQTVLAQANPQTMVPLTEGYRDHVLPSTYGGVQQRWVLIASEHRQAPAQRTVGKPRLKDSNEEVKGFKKLGRTLFACEAAARQALSTFVHGLQATCLSTVTVRSTLGYGKRGRPSQDAQPVRVVYTIEGALASSLATRQALIDQHRCFILATNELDEAMLSPPEVLNGYTGQAQAERGFRFLKDPQFLASSFYLKKPKRMMALLMVMTVCLLVYAALESHIRTALKDHGATFPDHKGKPTQTPTARWVFHDSVGIHVLLIPGQWDYLVVNRTEAHQSLLRLLGKPYERLYR
jgi:transposase